jgi:hypothetical protein
MPLVFLIWIFFGPTLWDTRRRSIRWGTARRLSFVVPELGHRLFRPEGQEPAVNLIDEHPARPPLAGNVSGLDEVGEIALGGASRDTGMQRKGADRREASAGLVGEADQALHRPP